MAIGLGFCKKPNPNTFEKGPFLLVPSFAGPVLSGLWGQQRK
jgi:hypothetical protein